MERLVIIPTYNEKENIEAIITAVMELPLEFNVLVIDDGSPDGTATIVKGLMADRYKGRVHLVERSGIGDCFKPLYVENAFFGGNLNESQSCSKFLRQGLDPIIKATETKCGAIIAHHTGKPKEPSGNILSYIGNGSAELTNYPRSILSIIPHKNLEGVFELVGAKHGDRLNWRNSAGLLTTRKVICYANKLPRYADKGRVIYWVEPTPEELADISAHQNHMMGSSSPAREVSQMSLKKANDKGLEENALTLIKYVKSEPSKSINNKSLREHAAAQWITQAARSAVKEFENIKNNHGIGKDSGYYTHNAKDDTQAV